MSIQTAGDLRGFLADVLVDIRAKRISSDEASAIAKVAAEINRSLAVEVQTALQAGVKRPVPGSMVIASAPDHAPDAGNMIPLPEAARSDVTSDNPPEPELRTCAIPQVRVAPKGRDGEKVWCEQCEMRVTASQAVSCKSPFCKAKEAA